MSDSHQMCRVGNNVTRFIYILRVIVFRIVYIVRKIHFLLFLWMELQENIFEW